MRILCGIATYPTEPYIYARTRDALIQVERGGYDIEFVQYGDDDPANHAWDNILNKHNRMRDDLLAGDYDALWLVEADIIVPPHALQRLTAVDADIAYGLYAARMSGMWLCFPSIDNFRAKAINANPAQARIAWGLVTPSEGVGFGCTLIHRRVLDQLAFRRDNRKFADDWHLALDAKGLGLRQAHDLGVVCGHIGRDESVIWPDPDAPKLVRREAAPGRTPVALVPSGRYRVVRHLWAAGRNRYILPGESIELDEMEASILLARKFIRRED